MSKITVCICALAISILLAGLISDGSHAITQQKARRGDGILFSNPTVKGSVVISGTFSGTLSRNIRLNGQRIIVNKNTRIFQAGKGLVDYGTAVGNSSIYISAVARDDKIIAKSIIVSRPLTDGDGRDGKDAGLLKPDEPR
jgi:hypothetical protein